MIWTQYLLDMFAFNDTANRQILKRILDLPDRQQGIMHFSHLINSQIKWMARIKHSQDSTRMSWWDPVYDHDELESRWSDSLRVWTSFVGGLTDEELNNSIQFFGSDGVTWEVKIKDIALQLNYHSIHHRAQIQMFIRLQGQVPDFIDYVGTVYRKISE